MRKPTKIRIALGAVVVPIFLIALAGFMFPAAAVNLQVWSPEELRLPLAWNDSVFEITPPAEIPDSIKKSWAFWKYRRTGALSHFEGIDSNGNRVVVDAMGIVKIEGRGHVVIPQILVYSPQGNLINKTVYMPDGRVDGWTAYEVDGDKIVKVSLTNRSGQRYINEVTVIRSDKSELYYQTAGTSMVASRGYEMNSEGKLVRAFSVDGVKEYALGE